MQHARRRDLKEVTRLQAVEKIGIEAAARTIDGEQARQDFSGREGRGGQEVACVKPVEQIGVEAAAGSIVAGMPCGIAGDLERGAEIPRPNPRT